MDKLNKGFTILNGWKKLTLVVVSLVVLMFAVVGCGNGTGEIISDPDTRDTEVDDTISTMREFNECLSENGMTIYGMEWCPACSQLVETLGGYESAQPVYVECTDAENQQKCQSEMQGNAVPEVQLNGEMFQGSRSLEGFSEATGCEIPA